MIQDGAVLIRDGVVAEVGPTRRVENLASARGAVEIDAARRVVMPGFVDSHTHLVSPPRGERRAADATAAHVMRTTSAALIEAHSRPILEAMARHGTTTVEAKTGCGPDESAETKALRVLTALRAGPIDLVRTFLLRIPPEASAADAARIVDNYAPRILRRSLAEFADIAWDGNPARRDACARFLEIAGAAGLGLKVHAAGPNCAPALALAIGYRAASVDHLELLAPDLVGMLSQARTVATLIPGAALAKGAPLPPARLLIEAGAAVALASGFNPDGTPTLNMQTVVALACIEMGLTPAEAIVAATINGAHALTWSHRIGSIEPGKAADVLLLDLDDYREMPRVLGANLVHMTIKRGIAIYQEGAVRPSKPLV